MWSSFCIILQQDLIAAAQLCSSEDLMPLKQRDVLLIEVTWQGVGRRRQIEQTAALCFIDPFLCVAISVEDDALVLLHYLAHQGAHIAFQVGRALQLVGKLTQLFGGDGVQHDIGAGNGNGRAQHAELELVAGEGEGGGAVAVRGVALEPRQGVHAEAQLAALGGGVGGVLLQGLEDGGELIAEENGDHGGGASLAPRR